VRNVIYEADLQGWQTMKEQDGICLRKSISTFSIHLYKNGKEEVEKIAKA